MTYLVSCNYREANGNSDVANMTPEEKGEALEQATLRLLHELFPLDASEADKLLI